MSPVVLDASAAVEIILNTVTGQQLKSRVATDDVWVPEHFYIEIAGVFRRMQRNGAITTTNAGEAFTELITQTSKFGRAFQPSIWRTGLGGNPAPNRVSETSSDRNPAMRRFRADPTTDDMWQ